MRRNLSVLACLSGLCAGMGAGLGAAGSASSADDARLLMDFLLHEMPVIILARRRAAIDGLSNRAADFLIIGIVNNNFARRQLRPGWPARRQSQRRQ